MSLSRGRVGRVVLIGLLSALCIGSNYLLLPLWNIKLMDSIVFLSSFLYGLDSGVSVAAISWLVYGTLNPYGFSFPALLSVIIGEMVYALAGHLVSRGSLAVDSESWMSVRNIVFGIVGLISTFLYDVFTNAVTGWLFYGSVLLGLLTMNFPIPMGIIHEVSNFFIFALLAPPVIHSVRRRYSSYA